MVLHKKQFKQTRHALVGSMEVVDVQPYDFSKLPKSGFYLMLGRRGRGKTTWSQYILQQLLYAQEGIIVIMVGSERVRQSWARIAPRLFVVDISTDYILKLCNDQDRKIEKYKSLGVPFPARHHVTFVLDDTASNRKFQKSQAMQYVASNSRQLEITTFVLAQYLFQIISEVRSQFDVALLLATSNAKNIRNIREQFASSITMRVFKGILSAATENYGMLVIDDGVSTFGGSSSGNCFYARIDPYPPVLKKLGSNAQWEFSKTHYLDLDRFRRERLRRERERDEEKEVMADEDCNDSDIGGEVNEMFFCNNMDVLDNRRIFSDRMGRIIVRRVIPGGVDNKRKKD